MIVKAKKESTELKTLTALNNRMKLAEKDYLHFLSLKKGHEGEVLFERMLEKLHCESLILNDLLLQVNQTTFQIDSLMIMSDAIYLFEVKNFEGDYYYKPPSNKIIMKSREIEIVNPLIQMRRCETLLIQLLQSQGFKFPIKSTVIFVNPEFTLYQAPMDQPIVFPTQIKHFLKQFDVKSSRVTSKNKLLAEKLISLHLPESPYSQIPSYEYEQLKRGVTCAACHSFLVTVEGHGCVCTKCGHRESVSTAVMRSVREFKMLFPDEKITTSRILDWCQVVESRKRMQRILERNLKLIGKYRGAYFE